MFFFTLFPITTCLVFSYSLNAFNHTGNPAYLWAVFSAGTLFLVLFFIQSLIIDSSSVGASIIFAESVALITFFYRYAVIWVLVAFLIVYLLLFFAYQRGRRDLENMVSLKFFSLRRTIAGKAMTALLLFGIILFMSTVQPETIAVSPRILHFVGVPLQHLGRFFIKDFSLDAPLATVVRNFVIESAQADLAEIPSGFHDSLINATMDRTLAALERTAGVSFGYQESVFDAFHRGLNHRLQKLPPSARTPLLLAFSSILFFFLTGFGFFLTWVVSFLAWAIFRLLLAVNFAIITTRNKNSEIVTI